MNLDSMVIENNCIWDIFFFITIGTRVVRGLIVLVVVDMIMSKRFVLDAGQLPLASFNASYIYAIGPLLSCYIFFFYSHWKYVAFFR